MTHYVRVHALSVLTDRVASPKELAAELECSVRHVTYHLEKLEELGAVEVVGYDLNGHNGRSVETFYRAIDRAWFDRDAWKAIGGGKAHPNVTGAIMSLINEDIAHAVTAGTFDGDENHISRTPMLVDAESYDELIAHMTLMLEGIFAIKERAANRIQKDTPTISTVVNLIQFDLPMSDSEEADPETA